MSQFEKEPYASKVYRMEFHDRLLAGVTISTVDSASAKRLKSLPGPQDGLGDVTVTGQVKADGDRAVDFRIAGGRHGEVWAIQIRVTYTNGDTDEGTRLLLIRDFPTD